MPRQVKRIKPLIYVFYEGESEQQYIDYLKSCFSDVAVIKRCSKRASTNLFADTKSRFEKDKKYRDVAEATDEIWFFFDVESKDRADEIWSERLKTINCNGVQREHNKKLNNGLPILHKVPPKRDYGRYFCIMAEKGGTSHGGLTEKLSPFFHAKKQEVNAYGR